MFFATSIFNTHKKPNFYGVDQEPPEVGYIRRELDLKLSFPWQVKAATFLFLSQ
ncbi:hypothetical protein RSOCI_02860 [Rhabdochlamydiaceae symbiont of Dictyostelium giganteum]